MAISAHQIWISSAFRLVPTKLFTFKFCLRALKKNSISHRSSNKTLHFQVLFEGLEKQFNFPPVLVDGGDGGGPEWQEIAQQDDLPLVDWIPNHHAPHEMGTVLDRLCARKADEFIGQDVARQRPHGGFDDLIGGVVLQTCHEEH